MISSQFCSSFLPVDFTTCNEDFLLGHWLPMLVSMVSVIHYCKSPLLSQSALITSGVGRLKSLTKSDLDVHLLNTCLGVVTNLGCCNKTTRWFSFSNNSLFYYMTEIQG